MPLHMLFFYHNIPPLFNPMCSLIMSYSFIQFYIKILISALLTKFLGWELDELLQNTLDAMKETEDDILKEILNG